MLTRILWFALPLVLATIAGSISCGGGDAAEQEEPTATPVRVQRTPVRVAPASSNDSLDSVMRRASSAVSWIERNVDGMARCVAADRIDWDLFDTRLRVFAITLEGAGNDWLDGSIDSYSVYEVERAVDGAEQTIREIRSICGI